MTTQRQIRKGCGEAGTGLNNWMAGGLALLLAITSAQAAEEAAAEAKPETPPKSALEKFAEQDYMLGDWWGLRTDLSKHGVDFEFFYIASNPHNIQGGIETGSAYEGAALMLLDLDSQKLVGYEGGHFHAAGVSLHGQDHFSDIHIGDFNKVNLIDFPNAWRLWELWYEQKFCGDLLSLKFGQMAVDQDFLQAEFYNSLASINLLNQTFFYPTLAFNVYSFSALIPGFPGPLHALASSPYGAPGVRFKVTPTERIYAQFGAYDGYPNQDNGAQFELNKAQGYLLYFETGYRFNQQKGDTGLPGNLKLGAFYHTGDFQDSKTAMEALAGVAPVTFHPNTYGAYLLLDQTLWFEKDREDPAHQGLVGFFRLAGAPPDRNLTDFGIDGGLVYKGLIPTRDWDSIALAASYLRMSGDIREGQEAVNAVAPGAFPKLADYEAVLEMTYKAQMTAWWTIQTSIQRPIHPGGRVFQDNRDAWAFILASTLRL